MLTMTIQVPHGIDQRLDREVELLRSALFSAQCGKTNGTLSAEAEDHCRAAVAEVEKAHLEIAVVNAVYVARARMADVPALRLALHLADRDVEHETQPDRQHARSLIRAQIERVLAQRVQSLNESILAAHASEIADFRSVIARAARRIEDAIRAKVPA